jgi:predicted permease
MPDRRDREPDAHGPFPAGPAAWRAYVRARLPLLAIPPERALEIVDELALQLEATYESARESGATRDEALGRARAEVPDWDAFAAAVMLIEQPTTALHAGPSAAPAIHAAGHARSLHPRAVAAPPSGGVMRGFAQDLVHGVRGLLRAPGFAAVALLTLALALGLGTAAFSILDGILLRALPYPAADRLVLLHATVPPEGRETVEIAYPDAADLIADTAVFEQTAALFPYAGTTTLVDPAIRIEGFEVSPEMFDVFGLAPALGRSFTRDEGQPGHDQVAMLGYAFWRRLGSPADVVGTTLVLDERPRTIVGVTPEHFRFDILPRPVDVVIPLTRDHPAAQSRAFRAFRVIGRLRDGVSIEQATAAVATVGARLAQAFPDTNNGRTFSVHSLRQEIVGPVRPVLWLAAALVALVLLVATVNLAGLMLARAVARARELAVRLALGASRWRLARESLAEALVLALGGAAVGLVVSRALLDGLRATPGLVLPRFGEVAISWRAGSALLLAAAGVAIVMTVMPFALMRRLHALSALRTGHETAGRAAGRMRAALVAAQTSAAFVVLVAAVLLAVSLRSLLSQPLGFETGNVVTLRVAVPEARYRTRDQVTGFHRELLEAIRAQPQVQAAGLVSILPLTGNTGSTLTIQGREDIPVATRPTVGWQWASAGYFHAMGIPLVRGRDFTDADLARAPHVTVVNETLARLNFPGEDPIGKRVYFGGVSARGPSEWHEIIGVVGDVRHRGLEAAPDARAYDLFGQHWGRTVSLAVRTADSPLQVAGLVRSLVAQRDPALAVFAVQTTADLVAGAVATRRLLLWLVTGLAAIGLGIALIGLYGTVSYMVAQRTRELGVRVALGATGRDLARLVLGYALRVVAAGLAIGLAGAFALGGVMQTQLAGVNASNIVVLAVTALGLTLVALAACAAPVRRAATVDPAASLRYE